MDIPPQDDFKWFGEGFDGFPKKLPEDVVEYVVYIIDTKLSDVQTRERLQAFQRALNTLEKKFLKEYIWQRDPINLALVREDNRWLLKGTSNYGDSIADEWLIVWFLRELSREFKDAWIRIYDTDGEFLLIEAANALPRWVNPEVSENRVWIHDHQLRLIPLSPKEPPRPLKLPESLSILTKTPLKAERLPKVEEEAFHRLRNYPAAISENQHHATLPLPRKIAHILHTNPAYIAPAVEAFYLRDPISLRLLQPEKSNQALVFPPEDFVTVSVRFTRVLYAQLLGQQWVAPGPWGAALDHLVKEKGVSEEKAELAIKLSAGMEILASHRIYADKKPVRSINILLSDLESGDDDLPSNTEISTWDKREDDEKWLDIDFTEFEKELEGKGSGKGKGGKEGGSGGGFGDITAQENLRKMVERMTAFIEDEDAGLEGAKALGLDPMDVDDDSDTSASPSSPKDPKDPNQASSHPGGKTKRRRRPLGWDDPENSSDDSQAHDSSADEKSSDDDDEDDDDEHADAEFAEYEKALEKFMALSSAEKSALLDDARELARTTEAEQEEDEEIRKLSEAMEAELFSHGALNLNPDSDPNSNPKAAKTKKPIKPATKPAPKPHTSTSDKGKGKAKAKAETESNEVGIDENFDWPPPDDWTAEGAGADSDNDDDEDLLDEDYNLADNMLKSFKGQVGMAGPAGNLMKMMGVQFPPDADDGDFSKAFDRAIETAAGKAKAGSLGGGGEGSSK